MAAMRILIKIIMEKNTRGHQPNCGNVLDGDGPNIDLNRSDSKSGPRGGMAAWPRDLFV